jgi:hypothetical protein
MFPRASVHTHTQAAWLAGLQCGLGAQGGGLSGQLQPFRRPLPVVATCCSACYGGGQRPVTHRTQPVGSVEAMPPTVTVLPPVRREA